MSIESALYQYLLSKPSIAGLVGIGTAARIFPDLAPKNDPATQGKKLALPYIVYQGISDQPEHHVKGRAGIVHTIMQIDCYGATRVSARALSAAVRNAMDGARSPVFGSPSDYVNMRSCFLDIERSEFQEPTDGSEKGVYRVWQDWSMWYVEPIPALL